MHIRLLDDDLINKIAAGEVIERPASIVKELLENSIDAGAGKITVTITGGGCEKIEVEDDGQGIGLAEVPLALLRHATSKIRREEDLHHVLTMGFRGEALPSIASVSRMDIFSKNIDEPGVHAYQEGGQLLVHEVHSSPPGTRIAVKDLFYNTPARKKFLKTAVTESNHIHELMCKYALARPDISFSYHSEKKSYFKTPGNGTLLDAVIAVYGREFSEHLMEIQYLGDTYQLKGLISKPEVKRANRKNQLFFINHRPIRSPILFRAIDRAYQGRLLAREHPVVLLSIGLDPSTVDVNVHPQKSEIRFRDEQGIFRIVLEVLREKLEKSSWSINMDYFIADQTNPTATYPMNRDLGIVKQEPIFDKSIAEPSWERFITYKNHAQMAGISDNLVSEEGGESSQGVTIIGQVFNSYILLQKDDSLWIADQHAAHEKVWFDRLAAESRQDRKMTQDLILPITLELTAKQMEVLGKNMTALNSLGFTLQEIGPNSIAIRAIPLAAAGREREVLDEILDELQNNKVLPDLNRKLLAIMSCKKAVKAGDRLMKAEMERIINELFALNDYQHCPHGRPTIIRLSYEDLERMFKRR